LFADSVYVPVLNCLWWLITANATRSIYLPSFLSWANFKLSSNHGILIAITPP
jgi:hypothetical protein